MKKIFVLAVVCALVLPMIASAQEEMKPKKYDSLEWFMVIDVQYEAGKMEEALKIIKEHFEPAGKAIGMPGPWLYMNHSGEWDVTFVWELDGGISDMEWEMNADNLKWMASFAKQAGGMEKATEILGDYMALVQDFDKRILRLVSGPEKGSKK